MTTLTKALLAALLGALAWGGMQAYRAAGLRADVAELRATQAAAVATAHRENARELTRLVQANQEIQHAYNQALGSVAAAAADRARTERVRGAERAAIVAAAERAAAGTCGRYAQAAERDLAVVEDDAVRLGHEAARASATAHALKLTIDQRRAALEAKRTALNPQAKTTTPEPTP
ncbi:hypothetical protein [Hydrogenophaga electricum]|uniref:Uncharacterized protein n=1 Tax=Hydrogenophaga electricum TaxID=1230953 RepID=A0ABQ6C1N3_9BURK|nr:hypothetical protein [Hydrogenophaga electricum]GLS13609.1 hypothetical protein GCM10007935_10390 [Hydrogenophaga electricum]